MKEQFADYETSRMLKELGFEQKFEAGVKWMCTISSGREVEGIMGDQEDPPYEIYNPRVLPSWHQIEQWLWEEHKVWFNITFSLTVNKFIIRCYQVINEKRFFTDTPSKKLFDTQNDSPITAKIEGIKQVVKYLHEKE